MPNEIIDVTCTQADKFIKQLRFTNPIWDDHPQYWVFRGHSNDEKYELLPSALRTDPEPILGYTYNEKRGVQMTNREQIDAEFERIHEFYWSIDKQGLIVPGNNDMLRTPAGWQTMRKNIRKEGWPITDLLPLLAMAQHYGVHTRLLDWSDQPLVAAYFAAKGAAKNQTGNVLSVWALNLDWVIHTGFPSTARKMGVYVVTAPRATNPNLHAQGGILTTENLIRKEFGKATKVVPVNKIIEKKCKRKTLPKPVMAHITLPVQESKKLLRLLNNENIGSATIFPGYKGVADSLKEKALWDHPERDNYWLKQ